MRLLAVSMGVVASAAVAAGTLGAGVAIADNTGLTYAKAAERIRSFGGTPVIASVVGDQLATDDCIVIGQKKGAYLDASGDKHFDKVYLHLNCGHAVAEPGKPGNSAATPAGRKGRATQAKVEDWNNTFPAMLAKGKVPWCGQSAENADTCLEGCTQSGSCSDEVLKYLGSVA